MNPFEKIFNYQILSRMEGSGAVTITSHERTWLRAMLAHPAAMDAFEASTLAKLREVLAGTGVSEADELYLGLQEKAGYVQRQVYRPLLRVLRRIIVSKDGVRISYILKNGTVRQGLPGYPCKLEYSMVKREWYLHWLNTQNHSFMSTKLRNIVDVESVEVPAELAEKYEEKLGTLAEARQRSAEIQVVPEYNVELSRILYAFSCFDKEVRYDEEQDTYTIKLTFSKDEMEFILSKVRFLGKRVCVVKNKAMQVRMAETAAMALGRYG
ncbi:hypothetical protein SY83_01650 [Paenibacillus swuensis]|uniref:WYL domain-containing protein n=1 Tax=Paenibacillus swuensis TaxID=1178515 RepID=A0A172TDW9_9BACL|nr:WYL domain-containing protein [Paenibacillus swuensis]ANE45245.1 hypothetical protein SY83_01650 [Paenibacillus swuensis]